MLSTIFIVGVAVTTIFLWVIFDQVQHIFGHIGIVGLLPIITFGASGYITKVDFNAMPWDVLVLIGGGLSLGLAVESSGLLIAIGDKLTHALSTDLGVVLLAFSTLVAILANFISSTVAAVILLPLVATVGQSIGHPKLLVVLCAFMTSGAMGLPVSSFPNANSMAVGVSCGSGKPEGAGDQAMGLLRTGDYVRTGFPMAALVLVLVNTLGRGIAELHGW